MTVKLCCLMRTTNNYGFLETYEPNALDLGYYVTGNFVSVIGGRKSFSVGQVRTFSETKPL
jgi:hypothetical protein